MIATNHGSTSSSIQSNARPAAAARSSQRAERSAIDERERRKPDDHQDQRTLEQDAGGERGPQDRAA